MKEGRHYKVTRDIEFRTCGITIPAGTSLLVTRFNSRFVYCEWGELPNTVIRLTHKDFARGGSS